MSKSQISVLGTGLMGSAIARALASCGHEVVVWNRSPAKAASLASAGCSVETDMVAALRRSPSVFLIVNDYTTATQMLHGARAHLRGKMIVNGITGTAADAREMARLVHEAGGSYLDAGIECFPVDVGTAQALINYSGDDVAWAGAKDWLMQLGGAGTYLGGDPGAANLTEAALTGAFFNVALGAYLEASAFAAAAGLSVKQLLPTTLHMLDLLRRLLCEEAMPAIESGDFGTDQATLDVYLAAVSSWRKEMLTVGQRASLMTANLHNLELAQAGGHGSKSIYAQFLTAGVGTESRNLD